MTQTEALRLALEALCAAVEPKKGKVYAREFEPIDCYAMHEQAITAIKAALEAKDEFVATLEDLEQEIYENTRQFVSFDVMEWMLKRYYTTPPQRTWVGLMRGVRVEGNAVVITVKGGNDEARALCGELINEMEKNT